MECSASTKQLLGMLDQARADGKPIQESSAELDTRRHDGSAVDALATQLLIVSPDNALRTLREMQACHAEQEPTSRHLPDWTVVYDSQNESVYIGPKSNKH